MNRIIIGLLALALGIAIGGEGGVHAQNTDTTNVQVRVWQDVRNGRALYVSARPEDGSWRAFGTRSLGRDDARWKIHPEGWRYSEILLTIDDWPITAMLYYPVNVRIWQSMSNAQILYVDVPALREPVRLVLNDGYSASGRFRYGDASVPVVILYDLLTVIDTNQFACPGSVDAAASYVRKATFRICTNKGCATAFHAGNGWVVSAAHLFVGQDGSLRDGENPYIHIYGEGWYLGGSGIHSLTALSNYDIAVMRVSWRHSLVMPDALAFANVLEGRRFGIIGYNRGKHPPERAGFTTGQAYDSTQFPSDSRWMEISSTLGPGSSGGPIFDYCGRVVGMVKSGSETANYTTASYLPGNIIRRLIADPDFGCDPTRHYCGD